MRKTQDSILKENEDLSGSPSAGRSVEVLKETGMGDIHLTESTEKSKNANTSRPESASSSDRPLAVVFDFDGTLYDKHGFVKYVIGRNIIHWKLLISERRTRRSFHGRFFPSREAYYEAFFSTLAKNAFRSVKYAQRWYIKKYKPSLTHILEKHFSLREGFNEFFHYCNKSGIMVVLYSDYEIDERRMAAIGADSKAFDYLLAAPDFGGLKPSGQAFSLALKKIGRKPSEVLFVGDSIECDGGVARNTGCRYMDVREFIGSDLFLASQHPEN